jgi:hypothetical protein
VVTALELAILQRTADQDAASNVSEIICMLHIEISPVSSSQPFISAGFVNNHVRMNQTLLTTVLLFISDSKNVPQLCRALLDSRA